MKVLLTGAAGFIGTAVDGLLTRQGHEVIGVDIMLDQAHRQATAPPGIHRLDVRDAQQWIDLLNGVDVVCHQAALVGSGSAATDLPIYASHNDVGTCALLAAMHTARVGRLVLASSMVVYGEGRYACVRHGRQHPGVRTVEALKAGDFENHCPECGSILDWQRVPETARLAPRSAYAASKVAQEHYAAAWSRQTGAAVIALRYHNVYGPGMPRDTPYSGVAAIFRSALEQGDPPQVFEDGGQVRDFVHVDDVAAANLVAVEAVSSSGFAAVNVCSGRPITIRKVAELLARGNGPAPVVTGRYRLGDVRHVVASPERAKSELGFVASVSPEQGIPAFATAPLRS